MYISFKEIENIVEIFWSIEILIIGILIIYFLIKFIKKKFK